jgi:hypothetical protein
VYVLYLVGNTVWFPTTHFANKFIGLVILAFAGASIVAALLAVFEVYRKLTRRVYA